MTKLFKIYAVLYPYFICLASCVNTATPFNATNFTALIPKGATFRNLVLNRRTRTIVFPSKAFLLLTPAFTKAVLDGRPRGLSYSIEFDMYSPLPDTVEAWQPTILLKKFKNDKEREQIKAVAMPPPATDTAASDPSDEIDARTNETLTDFPANDHFDVHEGQDYDADFWRSPNERYKYPLDEPLYAREWQTNPVREAPSLWHRRTNVGDSEYLQGLYQRTFQQKFRDPRENSVFNRFHKKPTLNTPLRKKYKHLKENKSSGKPTYSDEQLKYSYHENWSSYGPSEEVYDDLEDVPKWKFHQGYRERREIFEQLEAVGKIFQIDVKACLQRAMCEITTNLRPYGDSLMEDLLRILLSVPNDPTFDFGTDDDYSYMAHRYRTVNCVRQFAITCPYRVLETLTKQVSTIHAQRRAV